MFSIRMRNRVEVLFKVLFLINDFWKNLSRTAARQEDQTGL